MNKSIWKYIFLALLILIILVWSTVLSVKNNNLSVIFCDVGQGDAILIQHKSTQILIDGGANSRVLECLSRYMPFWDRKIDLVILTHPQEDHYGGLVDVFESYIVENFAESDLNSNNIGYKELEENVKNNNSNLITAKKGLNFKIGEIYIKTLHPSPVISTEVEKSVDPNDYSVINEITYGEFKILLTGDIGPKVLEDILAKTVFSNVDVLKVPHHGSKNGLTAELLKKTKPEVAVISAGSKNRFGHPHKEVLEMLDNFKINILRTDLEGDIVITTDGINYWR